MSTINLLYKDKFDINDSISVMIPKVGDVIDDEDGYYAVISVFTAMPVDMMVALDDAGIDFTTINEYDLFLMMFGAIREMDTHLVLGGLDLSKFVPAKSEQNDTIVLIDTENDIVIDRSIHGKIATTLRTIHGLEKNRRKPANKEAKEYMIERARTKQRRNKSRAKSSQLESLIVSLVNTEQFKYDFEGTRNLTIYQFNESVRQVVKKVDYDNRMYGVYTGTISAKDLSQDDLTWLATKNK